MRNHLAAAGLAVGLVAGSAAGLVLVPVAAVGQTTPPPSTPKETREVAGPREKGAHLRAVLAPLVADGTLTQAQADKVISALQAARPAHGHRGFHVGLDVVARTLGMTDEQLRTALHGGQSVADVARSRDIAVQTVIDALVAQARTRLAEKVTAGAITQAQADDRLAAATKMITSFVNGDLPKPGRGSRSHEDVRRAPAPGPGDAEEAPAPA
ncbi:MAG TPA: hypothetical protein VNA12_05060 [Mycobacteriales bacterium]|nr:hypothetical protein [Mycobacteriales bacterium]